MSLTSPPFTLTWAGKHLPDLHTPAALPLRETFAPFTFSPPYPLTANALYHGDNLPVLTRLLADGWAGRFRLIYADPPYNSGMQWARKVRLRGPRTAGSRALIEQQPQYADAWEASAYLQFVYERLPLLRDLLAEDGSLWLHCDHRHSHHLRCLLEEVLGTKNYLNTITWRSQTTRGAKVNAFYFANSAHTLHVFAKDRSTPTRWTPARKRLVLSEAQAAAEYMRDERGFFRTSDPGTFSFESLQRLHAGGRLYAPYGGTVMLDAASRQAWCSNGGNIGVKYYLADLGGGRHAVERGVDNIWDDIPGLGTTPNEDLGYPTQKTQALLARIIETATQPGDWVLDPFAGSGTTLAVAQRLARRWVGCDVGQGAVQTATRRLHHLIQGQGPAGAGAAAGEAVPAFVVYGAAEAAAAGLPQLHLAITPIAGDAARIRIVIERVEWPQEDRAALVTDWRAAVDAVAIDPAYDGCTLRVALADAPLRRTQWVAGEYVVPAPPPGAQVAVRVTDIWGQETLKVLTWQHPF
jgi:DNA modification methylase